MAKMSFLQRFPHAGIIMVFAVLFAIPLTVWSLNYVPTQTQQHASYSCSSLGGTCATSQICATGGFGTISGTTGCISSTVCCRFKPSPTPYIPSCASKGGTCVTSSICNAEGTGVISGTAGCTTGNVCCNFKAPTTCASVGGTCVTSTICSAEGRYRISATCTTGNVCCKF